MTCTPPPGFLYLPGGYSPYWGMYQYPYPQYMPPLPPVHPGGIMLPMAASLLFPAPETYLTQTAMDPQHAHRLRRQWNRRHSPWPQPRRSHQRKCRPWLLWTTPLKSWNQLLRTTEPSAHPYTESIWKALEGLCQSVRQEGPESQQ